MTRRHNQTGGRARAALAAVVTAGLAAAVIAAPPAGAKTAPRAQAAQAAASCNGAGPGTIPKDKIGVQFYNFLIPVFGSIVIPGGGGATYPANTPPNTQAQSQAALRTVFAALQSYGYTSFENFNFGGFFGYTAQQYRDIYESYGLHAVSDHSTLNPATIDARLDEAQTLGVKYVGSGGWPVGTDMNTLAGALNMASVLNQLGQKAAARGMKVYGHNHFEEFQTKLPYDVTGDGVPEMVPAYEVVVRNTNPDWVTFEVDVHWALEGLGYDHTAELVAFLRKYSKRIALLHVKGSAPTAARRIVQAGGPEDYTDWKSIFTAAADVDYYHFEYDTPPDPFTASKDAYNFLECIKFGKVRDETGGVGGTVPATLSLTMGTPASFGSFQPGVARDYTASGTATVISTAGDATLSVADPSSTATGRLVNGTYSLPQPVQAGTAGVYSPVGGASAPALLKTWSAPTSNEAVTINFKQSIGATDALRTGPYSKTLTFTLSTTQP